MPQISFISPVYKCRDCLTTLVEEIDQVARDLEVDYEVILVDDGCPQGSWEIISGLGETNPHVRGLKLSRNFGQHSAIEAGLSLVSGDWVVVLDCDLQDRPVEVKKLYKKAVETDADLVLARRTLRNDPFHRRLFSKMFYGTLSYLTNAKISAQIANFGIYRRRVVEAYNSWSEEQKFFPVMIQWMGFEQEQVEVSHGQRHSGKSSYRLRSLISLGVKVVLSFSDRPLWLMSGVGTVVATGALFASIFVLLQFLFGGVIVEGWTSLALSIWFLGGANIAAAGFLGIYLGRTLRESKGRPTFIISKDTRGAVDDAKHRLQ